MKPVVAILIGLFAIAGILAAELFRENAVNKHFDTPQAESKLDEYIRWGDEARGLVATAVSNDVVGLSRIVNIDTQTHDDDMKKWKATATVEFVNQIGGVERTNYPYLFFAGHHDPYSNKRSLVVIKDVDELHRRWRERMGLNR